MVKQKIQLIDGSTRRFFLKQSTALAGLIALPPLITPTRAAETVAIPAEATQGQSITLKINRKEYTLDAEPRETLLDVLRERLDLTGSKKGCDHGQCGACTVHIDGRTANACLLLAVMQQGREITTIEGLAPGNGDVKLKDDGLSGEERLHPLQTAFIKHDGLQCGFCTPGQLMSGVAVLREGHADSPAQIREWMSGNICRCGAYAGIVAAIESVKKGDQIG